MKIGYFALTEQGVQLAERLNKCLPGEIFPKTDLKHHMEAAWHEKDALVCIMAAGIVVRYAAPLLQGKDKDPAVIVMDSQGRCFRAIWAAPMRWQENWPKSAAARRW